MNQVEYWIWLQQALGYGSAKSGPLLDTFGSAEGVYRAGSAELAASGDFGRAEFRRLCDKSLDRVEKITSDCLRLGYRILTPEEPEYPDRLRTIYAPPCVLYVMGDSGPADALAIAVVGTRQVTEYGLAAAAQLAAGLASHGATVVSGLALGVDTAAHKGALSGGGKTIAVIGCGIDIGYPASNRELKRLIASNGAVISEYPPGTPPLTNHFPIRNRIIAGLSLGTLVIEAGVKSGSLITAGLAAEMGRDVFAVPGSIFSPMSEGTNRLLRDGAKPVLQVADILEEYMQTYPQSLKAAPESSLPKKNPDNDLPQQLQMEPTALKPPSNLTQPQTAVYRILTLSPIHVDEIALKANMELRAVLGALTTLEIEGFARSYPGRRFAAVPPR